MADPAAVPAAAVRLRVAAVPGVRVSEDGCAVTPEGSPEIATDTLPEKPLTAVANTETVDAVPFDGKLTEAGMTLSEKSAAAACTEREPWVLTAWPPMVVLKETIAVVVAAEAAAVSVNGKAVPGVRESVDGEIATPVGNPDTVTVAAPVPEPADSRREACCPLAPDVSLIAGRRKRQYRCTTVVTAAVCITCAATTGCKAHCEQAGGKNRSRAR